MSCLETFKRILARDQGTIHYVIRDIEKHIINLHNDMYDFHGYA